MDWLRATYGLPPTVIPQYWHRRDELVWELSALHLHWLNSYDPDGSPSAPIMWHRDFADARQRLREWVATCGTRLDRDRPTRQTAWPGEEPQPAGGEVAIEDRGADFIEFVMEDIAAPADRRTSPRRAGRLIHKSAAGACAPQTAEPSKVPFGEDQGPSNRTDQGGQLVS